MGMGMEMVTVHAARWAVDSGWWSLDGDGTETRTDVMPVAISVQELANLVGKQHSTNIVFHYFPLSSLWIFHSHPLKI